MSNLVLNFQTSKIIVIDIFQKKLTKKIENVNFLQIALVRIFSSQTGFA